MNSRIRSAVVLVGALALVAVLLPMMATAQTTTTSQVTSTTASSTTTTAVPPTTVAGLPVISIAGTTDARVWSPPGSECSDAIVTKTDYGTVRIQTSGSDVETLVYLELSGPAASVVDVPRFTDGRPVAILGRPETVRILVWPTYATSDLELIVTIVPGDGYEIGDPAAGSLLVRGEALRTCDAPTFTANTSNTEQRVPVGGALLPLEVVPYAEFLSWFVVDQGSLPPGVALERDGSFSGRTTIPGTWTVVIAACTPFAGLFVYEPGEPYGPCTRTTLTVIVGGGRAVIPATG